MRQKALMPHRKGTRPNWRRWLHTIRQRAGVMAVADAKAICRDTRN